LDADCGCAIYLFLRRRAMGQHAKAAGYFGNIPNLSVEVIAGLEHTLGVPLLERSPKGVHMTL